MHVHVGLHVGAIRNAGGGFFGDDSRRAAVAPAALEEEEIPHEDLFGVERLASGEEVVEDLLGGASLERAGFDLVVVEPPEAAAAGVEASPP